MRLGNQAELKILRDSLVLAAIQTDAGVFVCYTVIGAIGLALLGLFLSDRSRPEVLLLAIASILIALIRFCIFAINAQVGISVLADNLILNSAESIFIPVQVYFYFGVARRRMPAFILIPLAAAVLWATLTAATSLVPYALAVRMEAILNEHHMDLGLLSLIALIPAASALIAFLPLRRLSRDARVLAVFCWIWAITDLVWFALETSVRIPGMPDLFDRWNTQLAEARGIALLCIVVALMALLLREQRRVVEDRAQLAGEMHAAGEIQQMLAPDKIDSTPRLRIDVAFRPMREVGGDFYLCRILPDGRQRVLVGDVSGKGAAAAMAATLILGAAAARDCDRPPEFLAQLTRVLSLSRVGGFATCLCVDVSEDGQVTIANAGHLPPYLNGEGVSINNGLPLGIMSNTTYAEATLHLVPGDHLTFLSDGVLEARNSQAELYGFDRTRAISMQSAEAIARAAQAFGQEDDITVLMLTFAPAEALHA